MRLPALLCASFLVSSASGGAAYEVYVSSEKDNSISVIDTRTLEVTRAFKVGKRPRGITFSRDGNRFFVCASDSDTVQVYSTTGDTHLHDLPSGADPEQFALAPDDSKLFIANEDDAVTTVVDISTRQVVRQVDVGVEPEGMAVSPNNALAVATSETTNMAHIINAVTYERIADILVPPRPRHAIFTADSRKLWVSSEIGGTVSIIDTTKNEIEKTINFKIDGISADTIQPVGIAFNSSETQAFVALGPANRVAVIDMATREVVKYLLVGQRVWHLALTPDDELLFTTNGVSNDVTVVDAKRLKPIKSIKVGRYPWGVAVRPKS